MGDSVQPEEGQGVHPAWQPVLEGIPTEFHATLISHLQEIDRNANKKIEELNGQVKQYSEVIGDADLNVVRGSLELVNALNENPRAVYDRMREAYKFEEPVAQSPASSDAETDDYESAEAKQLRELQQKMQAFELTQQQQLEQARVAEQQAYVDQTLAELHSKHGDFDDVYVLAMLGAGIDPEIAVTKFKETVSQYSQPSNAPEPPEIMGASGAVPDRSVNPAQMSNSEVEDFAAQYIKQNLEASKG